MWLQGLNVGDSVDVKIELRELENRVMEKQTKRQGIWGRRGSLGGIARPKTVKRLEPGSDSKAKFTSVALF
ncbi:Protein SFI1 [Manis javanica]|nr:Protein SFI1 [Manis javanica]